VTAAAEVVQRCIWQWNRYLERSPGTVPGSMAVRRATDNFRAAAQDALGVDRTVAPYDDLVRLLKALGPGDNLEEHLEQEA
jgi:hypothetical protein